MREVMWQMTWEQMNKALQEGRSEGISEGKLREIYHKWFVERAASAYTPEVIEALNKQVIEQKANG